MLRLGRGGPPASCTFISGQPQVSLLQFELYVAILHHRSELSPAEDAEPCAPPNGGPTSPFGNSGVRGGPPSVS